MYILLQYSGCNHFALNDQVINIPSIFKQYYLDLVTYYT